MAEDGLSFLDLNTHVAVEMGVAYYGAAGATAAAPPTDAPTLARIKGYVNGGLRMFLFDAPPTGWEFQHPVAEVVLWVTSDSTANGAPAYANPLSTVTVHTTLFYGGMVGHDLAFTVTSTADGTPTYTTAKETSVVVVDDAIFKAGMVGQDVTFSATSNSYTILGYTNTKTVTVAGDASNEADEDTVTATHNYVITSVTSGLIAVVTGDASSESDGATITVTADGTYTLPATFGGEYSSKITYAAGTNQGVQLTWEDEGIIRHLLENVDSSTGTPGLAAVRKMDLARRWELLVYPLANEQLTVLFPYELHFTALSADADVHPAGAHYDEAVKAACEAYAELHGEDSLVNRNQYYMEKALPAAYRRNSRSIPKKLGSLKMRSDDGRNWRDYVRRPDVTTP